MSNANSRMDHLGRAYAGSQLQIQIYVNRRQDELSHALAKASNSLAASNPRLHWVSPLETEEFVEYQDNAFLRAVGLEHFADELREFWPKGGPVWDALASVEVQKDNNQKGIILVEAKSHPPEIYGGGMKAKAKESTEKIEKALNRTKRWLGVSSDTDWTGPLYQSANRLAHLYFFREIVEMPAWLVNIYFLNDPHSPTSRKQWVSALEEVKERLGLEDSTISYTGELFLEGRDRQELLRKPQ